MHLTWTPPRKAPGRLQPTYQFTGGRTGVTGREILLEIKPGLQVVDDAIVARLYHELDMHGQHKFPLRDMLRSGEIVLDKDVPPAPKAQKSPKGQGAPELKL